MLTDSIESILNQTYPDFELIIVDDGSNDRTEAVVEGFDDPRIRYVAHETNQGVSAARNTGIARSQGDIIAFQDSDDEWFSEKLRKQMDVFQDAESNVGIVYTGMFRGTGKTERYLPGPDIQRKRGNVKSSLLQQNFISTQMTAVRHECFDEVGLFDETLPYLEDWELWLRLSQYYQFELIDEPLVKGSVESDSISKNASAIVEARERVVEKHYDLFDTVSLANHLFFIGHGAMKVGRTTKGRRYLRKALLTNPELKYAAASVVSHFGKKPYDTVYRAAKSLRNP